MGLSVGFAESQLATTDWDSQPSRTVKSLFEVACAYLEAGRVVAGNACSCGRVDGQPNGRAIVLDKSIVLNEFIRAQNECRSYGSASSQRALPTPPPINANPTPPPEKLIPNTPPSQTPKPGGLTANTPPGKMRCQISCLFYSEGGERLSELSAKLNITTTLSPLTLRNRLATPGDSVHEEAAFSCETHAMDRIQKSGQNPGRYQLKMAVAACQ